MPWPIDFRKALRRTIVPCVGLYMMHLTCPTEEHFNRYCAERKRFEPEFCTRLEHPATRTLFEDHFIYATARIESCGFRNQHVTPYGMSGGTSRWDYWGVLNNFWFERRAF